MRTMSAVYLLCALSGCAPAQLNASIDASAEMPACTQPRATVDYSYLVFFDYGSPSLSPRAQAILTDLAGRWKRNGGLVLELIGHTDQQEARTASPLLAMDRVDATKTYLVSQGVEAQRIVTEGVGATRPLVKTDKPDPQNRRVEPRPIFRPSDEQRLADLDRLTCRIWVRDHCFTPSRLAHAGAAVCNAALSAATGS